MKRYSIIGVALLAASAITAMLVPSKSNASNQGQLALNGHLTASSVAGTSGDLTCYEGIVEQETRCSFTNTAVGAGVSGTNGVGLQQTLTITGNATGSITTIAGDS